MIFLEAILIGAAICAAFMVVAWVIALWSGNGGWVDTFWTLGTGLGGVASLVAMGPAAVWERQVLVGALVLLWCARLTGYLVIRTYGAAEDARYAELKTAWAGSYAWKMFGFLIIQAVAAIPLIAAFVLAAGRHTPTLDVWDFFGATVALIGIFGAGLADYQLHQFKARTTVSGQVCDVGLWGYSRHPNYFFEWLSWCAWPLIALDLTLGYPIGILAIIAPVWMYYLLVHVSGIPLLEAHMERSRGAVFAAYKKRVPRFFPRLPGFSSRQLGASS